MIFEMALREQKHRHWEAIREFAYGMYGQSTGLIFSVGALVAAAYMAHVGQPWVAGASLMTSVGGVVAHFIRGNKVYDAGEEKLPAKTNGDNNHSQVSVAAKKAASSNARKRGSGQRTGRGN